MTRRPLLPKDVVVRATRPYAVADPALSGDHDRAVRAAVIRFGFARRYARIRSRLRLCRW